MSKELRCADVVPGCDHVVVGETEQEVMEKGAVHAKEAHGIEEITPELAEKVKAAIRTT